MPMFPPETLTLIGTVVGIGIALATLILVTTARSNRRIDEHIESTDNKFDKYLSRTDERFDKYLSRTDDRFDKYLAEAANDRRALQSGMDEFRREMRRLAERQSRVEGHQSGTTAPAE